MSDHEPLPDFALTAYAAGGGEALSVMVVTGVLGRGTYSCPRCSGTGTEVLSDQEWLCTECWGTRGVAVLSSHVTAAWEVPVGERSSGSPFAREPLGGWP